MTGVVAAGTSTTAAFIGILMTEGNIISNGNTIGNPVTPGALTFSTTTTSATDVIGMYNFSSNAWTSNNNNVGGISATNLGASGTFVLYGLRANTGTTVSWTATSNNVGGTVANSMQLNATGTGSQVIGLFTPNAAGIFTSNVVRNMTTNIGTGTGTGASVVGIDVTTATPNHTLSQNTIFNLSNSNATAASTVTGIQMTGGTANLVERNFIHSLTVASNSATAEVTGIRVGGGTTVYRNNMIALGAGIANAIGGATTAGINGISEPLAGTDSFFHNSVYIGGAPTAGTGSSWAFNSTQVTNVRSYRDNIFFNARSNSGATGKNYAVRVGGAAPNPAGLTINNNLYFANGSGGVFGFFNALDVANLTAWKAAVGQDAGSFEANPQYNDPTNAVPDLHLHPTNPTVAEANGADVGVVNDFDGQTRASLTPVDIGADAGNFSGIDLSAPVITYAPFANTSLTTNRTLVVTITDNTGVATGGLSPRIYFNKNAGSYFSTQCSLASGTTLNGTWNCTIDYTLVGGVVVTDVIRYFVVAQDTLGQLAANPSSGFTGTDVNTVTPPTVPNQYTIVNAVSGSFNVGATEPFTSLTNTGGLFEMLNGSDITGNITINITSDLTGELGTVPLNEYGAAFSVLIKPSGAARQISTSAATSLIKLAGADKVTIDGSLSGGTDRSLTFVSTGAGAFVWNATNATSGANNNTVKNCIFSGPGAFAGQGVIAGSGAVFGNPAEFPNSNFALVNNAFSRVQNAVFQAGSAATPDQNWTISDNNVGSAVVADKVSFRGFLVQNIQNFLIARNTIAGINSSTGTSSTMSGITVAGVLSGTIERNIISDVKHNNTTGWGSNGIDLGGASAATANVTVQNNFISDIASQGFNGVAATDNGYGIMIETNGTYNVLHNTVMLTTNQGAGAAAGQTAALNIAVAVTAPASISLRNNILGSTQTLGTRFGVIDASTNVIFSTINNNDYFAQNVGTLGGTTRTTLANWQAATGQDAASVAVDPLLVSATDLHLQAGSPVQGLAQLLATVPADIDTDLRDNLPDIGADEIPLTGRTGAIPAGTYRDGYLGSATLSGNVSFTGVLNLTGIIDAGANTLTLTCTASTTGAGPSNYVVGNLRKDFCSTGVFTFPVGTTPNGAARGSEIPEGSPGEYSPMTATINPTSVLPSSLVVNVVDTWLPGLGQTSSTSRYWNITEIGDINADMTFQYLPEDVYGTETSYKVFKWDGVITTQYVPGTVNAGLNQFTAPGVSSFSGWAAGVNVVTAATANISGRVLTSGGMPIANVKMVLTGGELDGPIIMYTGSLGYYNFENLPVGQNYVVTVKSRRFFFSNPSQLHLLTDSITEGNFIADPQ